MSTTPEWHDQVTTSIGGKENYGRGIFPNPWVLQQHTWSIREAQGPLIGNIDRKIKMLFEPRFISGVETCELMESLIVMIGARNILELGSCTGFGTLHMIRAAIVTGGKVTSIDARPAHDRDFFGRADVVKHFEFLEGWTPDTLQKLHGRIFDFVFVDSAHDLAHTQKELAGLQPIIRAGTLLAFHDVPRWRTPAIREEPDVRVYLRELIQRGEYDGLILPSPRQLDCIEEYGDPNYPIECSPGLAVLMKK